jgi:hypothetical protein
MAGYDLSGGKSGGNPAPFSNLVADSINVLTSSASMEAYEISPGITGSWRVTLVLKCATVP